MTRRGLRPLTASIYAARMRLLLLLGLLALAVPAHATRFTGFAFSPRLGIRLPIVVRLHATSSGGLAGRYRCTVPAYCLFGAGALRATLAASGAFAGTISSPRAFCTIGGLFTGSGFAGSYICASGGRTDTGSFSVS